MYERLELACKYAVEVFMANWFSCVILLLPCLMHQTFLSPKGSSSIVVFKFKLTDEGVAAEWTVPSNVMLATIARSPNLISPISFSYVSWKSSLS